MQAAPQQQPGGHLKALEVLDQVPSGAEGAKALHSPQHHLWS